MTFEEGRQLPGHLASRETLPPQNTDDLTEYIREPGTFIDTRSRAEVRSRRAFIAQTIAATCVGATAAELYIDGSIHIAEAIDTRPSITTITEAIDPAYAHHAYLILVGYGERDAEPASEAFVNQLSKTGSVLTVRYDNNGINYGDLASLIGEKVEDEDITELSFVAVSAATTIALKTLPIILEGEYGITAIPKFLMDSSPFDVNQGLRERYAESGKLFSFMDTVMPVSSRGFVARLIGEAATHSNQYLDIPRLRFDGEKFVNVMADIWEKLRSPDAASTQLLNSTYNVLATSDNNQLISNLSEIQDRLNMPRTSWAYIASPTDWLTNTQYSPEMFNESLLKAGQPRLNVKYRQGILHGQPFRTTELYDELLAEVMPEMNNNSAIEYANWQRQNEIRERLGNHGITGYFAKESSTQDGNNPAPEAQRSTDTTNN